MALAGRAEGQGTRMARGEYLDEARLLVFSLIICSKYESVNIFYLIYYQR